MLLPANKADHMCHPAAMTVWLAGCKELQDYYRVVKAAVTVYT